MQVLELVLSAGLLVGGPCGQHGCPVLVGDTTPTGVFTARYSTDTAAFTFGYDRQGNRFAVHPVWTTGRQALLRSRDPSIASASVTKGCVNMLPEHFWRLPKTFKLVIRK